MTTAPFALTGPPPRQKAIAHGIAQVVESEPATRRTIADLVAAMRAAGIEEAKIQAVMMMRIKSEITVPEGFVRANVLVKKYAHLGVTRGLAAVWKTKGKIASVKFSKKHVYYREADLRRCLGLPEIEEKSP